MKRTRATAIKRTKSDREAELEHFLRSGEYTLDDCEEALGDYEEARPYCSAFEEAFGHLQLDMNRVSLLRKDCAVIDRGPGKAGVWLSCWAFIPTAIAVRHRLTEPS